MRERLLQAETVRSIQWQDGVLKLLDQRQLPFAEQWREFGRAAEVADAIRRRVVRGAQAIGIAAAYGVLLSARQRLAEGGNWRQGVAMDMALLESTRPTAVNLSWALTRMQACLARVSSAEEALAGLEAEAVSIHDSDREANLTMASLGLEVIRRYHQGPQKMLTHGNAGALGSGGFGSALGVLRAAWMDGLLASVHVGETRPCLQGIRLTAWELARDGVPVQVHAEAAAAHLMKSESLAWVVVGADRIAANGDVAAKIGTYQLAINAMHHGVRFMVVAPSSSIDMRLEHGDDIPLEQRDVGELLALEGRLPEPSIEGINPAFDVTPADLVDVIVTERGLVERPDAAAMSALMSRKRLH